MTNQADAIIVGAGLAGLAAAAELAEAGKRIIIVEQEPEQSLGGQAFWSFGGLFFVDSPEQRRMGIRDSVDLALQDWLGTAGFDRAEDDWPRKWAEAYVAFAAGEKRAWLHAMGVRFFPIVGWAERGGPDSRLGGARRLWGHRAWQLCAPIPYRVGHGSRHIRAIYPPSARSRTARAGDVQIPPPRQRAYPDRRCSRWRAR
jgi:predicted oxidoreductase